VSDQSLIGDERTDDRLLDIGVSRLQTRKLDFDAEPRDDDRTAPLPGSTPPRRRDA
jgi:hypothetical protein